MLRSGKNSRFSIVDHGIHGTLLVLVRHHSMDQSVEMLRQFFSVAILAAA